MNVRGAASNPPNRFIPLEYVPDPECPPDGAPTPRTQFFVDHSRSIIANNDSPDIGFTHSVNPYRGCEHGCITAMLGRITSISGSRRGSISKPRSW